MQGVESERFAWRELRRVAGLALAMWLLGAPMLLAIDAAFGWQLNAAPVAVALAGGALLLSLLADIARGGGEAVVDSTELEPPEQDTSAPGREESWRRDRRLIEEALTRDEAWRGSLAPELRRLALTLNEASTKAPAYAAEVGGQEHRSGEHSLVSELIAGRLARPDPEMLQRLIRGIGQPLERKR